MEPKFGTKALIDVGAFVISVAGWLLEYPAIYFYGNALVNNATDYGNNLSGVPLYVYETSMVPTRFLADLAGKSNFQKPKTIHKFSLPKGAQSQIYLGDQPSLQEWLKTKFSIRVARSEVARLLWEKVEVCQTEISAISLEIRPNVAVAKVADKAHRKRRECR